MFGRLDRKRARARARALRLFLSRWTTELAEKVQNETAYSKVEIIKIGWNAVGGRRTKEESIVIEFTVGRATIETIASGKTRVYWLPRER